VHHVVNPVFQAVYERKKEESEAHLGAANVNEQFLFHGTTLANAEAIVNNNFCLSKVGRNTVDDAGVCIVIGRLSSCSLCTHRTSVRLDETPGCQARSDSCYGRGFYFTDSLQRAYNVCKVRSAPVQGALLLCKVLMGKDKLIPSATPTPTYQQLHPHNH
jgi:hypothetical protein